MKVGLIAIAAAVAIVAMVLAMTRSNWQAPPDAIARPNPIPSSDISIAAGKKIYADRCASCHGDSGDGKGSEAARYATKPADFADPATIRNATDGEIFWKITVGNRPMPSFKNRLTEEQRWQVIDYIRTFEPQLAPVSPPAAPETAPGTPPKPAPR